MARQSINGHEVEVVVIAANGTTDPHATLTPREVATVEAVNSTLNHHAEFTTAYPGAQLTRVDSNRGVNENRHGRYYLRYQHAGEMTECWGHVAKTPTFDFKKGVVGVPMLGPSSSS
jgi:hypothetical protein